MVAASFVDGDVSIQSSSSGFTTLFYDGYGI
jgi:hypothetical protein